MLVLSLCKEYCPDKLLIQTGARLGEGADGEVFSIVGDPLKVIKLGVLYERNDRSLFECFKQIEGALNYLIESQPEAYARVYHHSNLGTYIRKSNGQRFVIYHYIMEKLEKISEDENRIFHSILSHEDRGIEKKFSLGKIDEMLQGMKRALDFDTEKVMLFCNNIHRASMSHLDIHTRNIMKDSTGTFKLIDLDRISLEKENV
jgi:hypothetical protein